MTPNVPVPGLVRASEPRRPPALIPHSGHRDRPGARCTQRRLSRCHGRMRDLLTTFVNALLSAQAEAVCGAGYDEGTPERVNSRNGYRHLDLDTRVGRLDVAVPKAPHRIA